MRGISACVVTRMLNRVLPDLGTPPSLLWAPGGQSFSQAEQPLEHHSTLHGAALNRGVLTSSLRSPYPELGLMDSNAIRGFAGIDLAKDNIPDATIILAFHHFMERHQWAEQYLREKGLPLQKGTVVDATIIHAPTSTRNEKREGSTLPTPTLLLPPRKPCLRGNEEKGQRVANGLPMG